LLDNILIHPDARIDLIDPYIQDVLNENLEKTGGIDKITVHQDFSNKVLRTFPFEKFDFIYIDGSHNVINVLEDAVLSFPLLKAGGILAFDDYLWNDPRYGDGTYPKPAIDDFLMIYKHKINLLYKSYQVWIQKKSGALSPPYPPRLRYRHLLNKLRYLRLW
jgi:hypothetical protein